MGLGNGLAGRAHGVQGVRAGMRGLANADNGHEEEDDMQQEMRADATRGGAERCDDRGLNPPPLGPHKAARGPQLRAWLRLGPCQARRADPAPSPSLYPRRPHPADALILSVPAYPRQSPS